MPKNNSVRRKDERRDTAIINSMRHLTVIEKVATLAAERNALLSFEVYSGIANATSELADNTRKNMGKGKTQLRREKQRRAAQTKTSSEILDRILETVDPAF